LVAVVSTMAVTLELLYLNGVRHTQVRRQEEARMARLDLAKKLVRRVVGGLRSHIELEAAEHTLRHSSAWKH
jgi:hypothetical protein